MVQDERSITVSFRHADQTHSIDLSKLVDGLCAFLDIFGETAFVSEAFRAVIMDGRGETKLARLLQATGHREDPKGFFAALLDQLARSDGTGAISINGVAMPHQLLMAILEIVLPGDRFLSITDVEQLEEVANVHVPETDRADMQQVIDTYPVRLSMHTVRQMRVSRNVSYQYLPFVQELDATGHTNTWIGQFHQGLLEQMYQNRVIFLLNMSCPVYCRFCFRKHKETRNEANPTIADVKAAVEHVRRSSSIKEIVITGGDPFMNRANLETAIDGLMDIDHVQALRLATRSIAYYPPLFLADEERYLNYLQRKHLELQQRGKRMEVATHFIHPDELSPQSLYIITELVKSGIAVYVQTPFLKDCNDTGPELVELFSKLRGAGAELHYIYIPCSPIHGNSIYWTPISTGLAVGHHLRAHLSDRVVPRICTATPIGKMDWHTSGWAVEPVKENENFIWIRSPYTPDYFKSFAPLAEKLTNIRINAEGTIDIQYMAKIGDPALFLGPRPDRKANREMRHPIDTKDILPAVFEQDTLAYSIVDTATPMLSRVHETRVELDAACSAADLDYIRADRRITDVVVVSDTGITSSLTRIRGIVRALENIPHVNALRLRSLDFKYAPHRFTAVVIDELAAMNRLTIVNPLRLEIETRFITAAEFQPAHAPLVRRMNNKGITVYSNTPLLGRINDTPESIHQLAYGCRQAGIEFHHLYVAGLAVQNHWNRQHPVALADVVDIATRVRREGSGREIPRYIIQTALGEADFGLSSLILGSGGDLSVKLLPYDLAYYKAMSPDFAWPEGVREDEDGRPVIPVTGLMKSTDFPLC